MGLEKPTYKIIKKDGSFELRDYDPYITSQVTVTAQDYNEAASRGFNPLANYIFGGNISKEKISMTSPVSAQPTSEKIAMTAPVTVSGSGTYTVEFFIPAKFTLESLPTPTNERVRFKAHPRRRVAAIRFSGHFKQKNFEKNIQILRQWIIKEGLEEKGEPAIAGYNPPFTPWFLKHNEVLIEV